MPWQISVIGDALVAFSFYIFYLVSKVNTYAAANVRVEEGQEVISTGVYGFVRHPMYFGALFLFIGTPLALGSWWTLLLFPVFLTILVARILNEEKVLARGLPEYVEYTHRVRYRMVRCGVQVIPFSAKFVEQNEDAGLFPMIWRTEGMWLLGFRFRACSRIFAR